MDSKHDSSTEEQLQKQPDSDRLVLAPVGRQTDVRRLARSLADRSRSGARIVMYPFDPCQ